MAKKLNKLYSMLLIILSVVLVITVYVMVFINQPKFGRLPGRERLARIEKSINYQNGQFRNQNNKPQFTFDNGYLRTIFNLMFGKTERLRPDTEIHLVKTDLRKIDIMEEVFVWFGHSSYLIQTSGKRILVDPVFCIASPLSFVNRPFKGTNIYKPCDMPDIDYLVITHDHWDHLDYETVTQLKGRVAKVICPLGVGEHLESWGFEMRRIVELDWNDKAYFDSGFVVDCLPAHHFSGRSIFPNRTLWASFMLQTPSKTIYIGGDGGYDTHFAEIGKRYPKIDIAFLENGQYNKNWKYIHLMPNDLIKATMDLNAKKTIALHNSKYALSKHPWDEPAMNVKRAVDEYSLNMVLPTIGKVMYIEN